MKRCFFIFLISLGCLYTNFKTLDSIKTYRLEYITELPDLDYRSSQIIIAGTYYTEPVLKDNYIKSLMYSPLRTYRIVDLGILEEERYRHNRHTLQGMCKPTYI